jgi:hypothetical protein
MLNPVGATNALGIENIGKCNRSCLHHRENAHLLLLAIVGSLCGSFYAPGLSIVGNLAYKQKKMSMRCSQ